MKIVRVKFTDWNGNERSIEVTSNMHTGLNLSHNDEEMILTSIHYIKRRYTECMHIISVEIIAD